MTYRNDLNNKIIIIKRKTRLEELIARFNTIAQVKFYIEHMGCDFSDYQAEEEQYKKAVSDAVATLEELGRVQIVDREYISNFIFGEQDSVVVIGQDGLVANTLKYLTNQLLIGVNPDPARWDGVLLPFTVKDLGLVVTDVFHKKRPVKEVTIAQVQLNDGQTMYGVNDIFIGQKTHVSARYQVRLGDQQENQSSSGIIISTGLGSTGWYRSIVTGAFGVIQNMSGQKNIPDKTEAIPWNSDYLNFSVREPFPSKTTQIGLISGRISASTPLNVLSYMPENGVIFSDGIENDYLRFNSGMVATVTVADKKGKLVV